MPAPDQVTGGCFCGAVRFRVAGPPLLTRACWCRDCQYLASGNASISAIFRSNGLVVSGALAAHESKADSGNTMRRRFCPACGTPLFSEAVAEPDYVAIRVGALDDREPFRPASTIWTDSAPGWGCWDRQAPHFPRQVMV
jgi:hypothetical protein